MERNIAPIEALSAELNRFAEESLLLDQVDARSSLDKKDQQVSKVLAMISHFISALRAGGLSPVTAKRELLKIIAVAIGLGLDSIPTILRALTEAKYVYKLSFKADLDLASILGLETKKLDQFVDPNSLMFLTTEDLKQLDPQARLREISIAPKEEYSMINMMLMQSKIKAETTKELKPRKAIINEAAPKKAVIPKKHLVNFVADGEKAASMIMPYFLEKKKKRTLH